MGCAFIKMICKGQMEQYNQKGEETYQKEILEANANTITLIEEKELLNQHQHEDQLASIERTENVFQNDMGYDFEHNSEILLKEGLFGSQEDKLILVEKKLKTYQDDSDSDFEDYFGSDSDSCNQLQDEACQKEIENNSEKYFKSKSKESQNQINSILSKENFLDNQEDKLTSVDKTCQDDFDSDFEDYSGSDSDSSSQLQKAADHENIENKLGKIYKTNSSKESQNEINAKRKLGEKASAATILINCFDEKTIYKTKKCEKSITFQTEKMNRDQTLSHLSDSHMSHASSKIQFNIKKIPTLNKEDLKYLEQLGKGAFGVVQKAYDIRSCSFLALKYCQPKESQSLEKVWEEIGPENDLLKKIEEIKNPIFLKYFGIKKDPFCEKNMVLVMESGEITIDDILKAKIFFSFGEALFIFRELVNQFEILQQHGIANRDVKPANVIIVQNQANEYNFKVADFGIGCHIVEQGSNHISIEELKGCSWAFSAPEVKEIQEETYKSNNYDPFKGDVFSLGITLKRMLHPGPHIEEIEYILSLLLMEKPEDRISFKDLNMLLKSEPYKKLIIQPSPINLKKSIELAKKSKDLMKTNKEKLKQYLENAERYSEICHYKKVEEFVILIESQLPEFLKDKIESNGEDEFIGRLFFFLATFYNNGKQDYKRAEDYYEKALKIKMQVFGEMHAETAKIYENLAIFYHFAKQNYQKAEDYYEKTIKIKLQVLGEIHPETAQIYNNLANFYSIVKQEYKTAENYYKKSLEIKLQVFGEMHAETANIYNCLAAFYKNWKQDYKKAEDYYERALKIRLHVFGEMHADTANIYENLAIFYNTAKLNYKKAEDYYEKALKIKLQVFGEMHAETAHIYNSLAFFYHSVKKDYNKEEVFYKKALKVNLQVFGEMHAETAIIFENLAIFYHSVKPDYKKAENYYEKTLKIKLQVFGEMHQEAASIYENIAIFYHSVKQDYKKAEDFYNKALQIKLQIFGETHAETASIFENLAIFHSVKKENKSAEDYYKRSLKIKLFVFGEIHVQTANIYENLAIFYRYVEKDYEKAEYYYEKTVNIKLQLFGEIHAETASIYNTLANFYNTVKQDYKKAEDYYEKALKIKMQVI